MKILFGCFLSILALNSCKVQSPRPHVSIPSAFNHHLGYLFIDTETGDTLLASNSEKYFIPASTTKLFTWYACLRLLNDKIPALRYRETSDSLIFWGTGDPSLLRPEFPYNKTIDFLRSKANKHLVFSDTNFDDNFYGKGWMWDDYLESYQAEVSALPIYGNLVRLNNETVIPDYFELFSEIDKSGTNKVSRLEHENKFLIPQQRFGLTQTIPFKTGGEIAANLLSDTLHLAVEYQNIGLNTPTAIRYSVDKDSLLIPMLRFSDNMLAEHLMLLCSGQLSDQLSVQNAIEVLLSHQLHDIPQKPRWVDGSGLSRYNLFTPEDLVYLLQKVKNEFGLERAKSYLPGNGQNGTMKNLAAAESPFLNAKSGSMSGVYNLAGFLQTGSGRTLTFAVMNNNFTTSVNSVRKEVEDFLLEIRNHY